MLRRLRRVWQARHETASELIVQHTPPPGSEFQKWDYKVVQMVAQVPADPSDASRKLGGALSAEALRQQFPEYYAPPNGRQQIAEFLSRLGEEGWELVQIQQVGDLPLMFLKRPRAQPPSQILATPKEVTKALDGTQPS